MKSFAYIKRCLQAFGIIPWDGTTSKIIDKLQITFFVILYSQYLCTSFCYLVFQQKDFIALCLSMFFSASGVMNVWIYSVFLLNRQKIIEIERDMNAMVNQREQYILTNFNVFLPNLALLLNISPKEHRNRAFVKFISRLMSYFQI